MNQTFYGNVAEAGQRQTQYATLHADAHGLHATTKAGQTHVIPWARIRFELGGQDNNFLYCRSTDPNDPSISSDAPGLLEAIREASGPAAAEALADIDKKVTRSGCFKRTYWGCLGAVVMTTLVVVLGVIAMTPTLLGLLMDAVPLEVDRMLGDAAYEDMGVDEGQLVTDPRVTAVVQEMVDRIGEHGAVEGFEYRVDVIRNDEVNAFALPGGQMMVYTGLLERAESPDQVAGVMAHEIAHVTMRHSMNQLAARAGLGLVVVLVLGDISGWMALAGEAAVLVASNSYSRDQESNADVEGARMLAAAGLNPKGLIGFFELLKLEPGSEMPEGLQWLSTHPEHQARIDRLNDVIPTLKQAPKRPLKADWEAMKEALGQ